MCSEFFVTFNAVILTNSSTKISLPDADMSKLVSPRSFSKPTCVTSRIKLDPGLKQLKQTMAMGQENQPFWPFQVALKRLLFEQKQKFFSIRYLADRFLLMY